MTVTAVWTGVRFSNLKDCRTRIKKFWNRSGVRVWKCDSGHLWLPPEVAGVTFSESDSPPAAQFLNPGPDSAVFTWKWVRAANLMRQCRNRFYSNAGHTRRIRKGRDVTKSYTCTQKTHRTHVVCIQPKVGNRYFNNSVATATAIS